MLQCCLLRDDLLKIIQSFLANRKQRTVLNGKTSNRGTVTACVPQGSILGPLFFLVYINDLTKDLRCNANLFGDDTQGRSYIGGAGGPAPPWPYLSRQIK